MEELTNKLLELKIESDGAVEIANRWITFKYFETCVEFLGCMAVVAFLVFAGYKIFQKMAEA